MSFLDALSAATNTAATAAGANQEGIQAGRQQNTTNLLDTVKLYQQKAAADLARQKQDAEIGHLGAQTNEAKARANALGEETFGAPYAAVDATGPGMFERGNRGTVRRIDGQTPFEKPREPTPVQPGEYVPDPTVTGGSTPGYRQVGTPRADPTAAAATRAEQSADRLNRTQANSGATQAIEDYNRVLGQSPAQKHPILSHVPLVGGMLQGNFAADSTSAANRAKAAEQTSEAAGNPAHALPGASSVPLPSAPNIRVLKSGKKLNVDTGEILP